MAPWPCEWETHTRQCYIASKQHFRPLRDQQDKIQHTDEMNDCWTLLQTALLNIYRQWTSGVSNWISGGLRLFCVRWDFGCSQKKIWICMALLRDKYVIVSESDLWRTIIHLNYWLYCLRAISRSMLSQSTFIGCSLESKLKAALELWGRPGPGLRSYWPLHTLDYHFLVFPTTGKQLCSMSGVPPWLYYSQRQH